MSFNNGPPENGVQLERWKIFTRLWQLSLTIDSVNIQVRNASPFVVNQPRTASCTFVYIEESRSANGVLSRARKWGLWTRQIGSLKVFFLRKGFLLLSVCSRPFILSRDTLLRSGWIEGLFLGILLFEMLFSANMLWILSIWRLNFFSKQEVSFLLSPFTFQFKKRKLCILNFSIQLFSKFLQVYSSYVHLSLSASTNK